MTAALGSWIKGLAGAAVLSAAALGVTPKGRVREVLRLVCGCVMALALVSPLLELDFGVYAESLASYSQTAGELARLSEETSREMNRTIIEERCAAYILDKANEQGLELTSVGVLARWSAEQDCWYPWELTAEKRWESADDSRLRAIAESALGVPQERQHWSVYEG